MNKQNTTQSGSNGKPRKPKQNKNKNKGRNQQSKDKLLIVQTTPAPIAKGVRGSIPDARYTRSKEGHVRVCHSELLGTVSSSGDAFSVVAYSINPGLFNFTSWLANIARNYESYIFKSLKFRYVPACPTTSPGQIYVTVDFDASDPAPLSEKQIAMYQGTKYAAPWNHVEYHCTNKNLHKRSSYFVRTGTPPANQDVVLFDTGNLFVATVGTGTASLGKIWVEYEVELQTPDYLLSPEGLSLSGRINGTDNFATSPSVTGSLPLTFSVNANALTMIANAPYSGNMSLIFGGTGLTVFTAVAIGSADVDLRSQCVNSAGAILNGCITFEFTAPGQGMTIAVTSPTTVTGYNLRVGQYDQSLG